MSTEQSAPAGYVMVPVEPNEAMLDAMWNNVQQEPEDSQLKVLYKALLAAAPNMNDQISVPRELLERIDETAICDGTEACINDDLFNELIALLAAAPKAEYVPVYVAPQHSDDVAKIDTWLEANK